MGSSRRLTDQERRQIVRERAKGVSVSAISAALTVSPKTVYNVLGRGRSAVCANDSRTRVLTMRVTDRDLRGFERTLAQHGEFFQYDFQLGVGFQQIEHIGHGAFAVAAIIVEEFDEGDIAVLVAEHDAARRIENCLGMGSDV